VNCDISTCRNNAYGGVLCSELGVLTALTSLKLANNTFIGVLGSELARFTALRELDVSNNRLRGTVPAALLARAGSLRADAVSRQCGLGRQAESGVRSKQSNRLRQGSEGV
jgi:hypothetical protein